MSPVAQATYNCASIIMTCGRTGSGCLPLARMSATAGRKHYQP